MSLWFPVIPSSAICEEYPQFYVSILILSGEPLLSILLFGTILYLHSPKFRSCFPPNFFFRRSLSVALRWPFPWTPIAAL